ncbi:MAG: thioredoxin [Sulfurospirillum sp.]|nr:MAG: thioredoxin [Sulfurospirillum sp.]
MSLEDLEKIIKEEIGVLLYFSTPTCNVCKALKPKISHAFQEHFPLIKQIYIDSSKNPEIPASMQIFSVPTIVVFLDGKEFARESRNISVDLFIEKIKRPYEIMSS